MCYNKNMRKLFLLTILLFSITVIATYFYLPKQEVFSSLEKQEEINDYIKYFYNRYSKHLDEKGLVLQVPDYGIKDFQEATTARELMSLATFYKYRALTGDRKARKIIREAITKADQELESRGLHTQSFNDAAAHFLMIRLIEQMPVLLYKTERKDILNNILARVENGINAEDTSNRATLSAIYWQYVVNYLYRNNLIDSNSKKLYDSLLLLKIIEVANNDVDKNGWYKEGNPMKFNPHYHLVSAFSFFAFGELTGVEDFKKLAEQMTDNLRKVTFSNGMVEARIGQRPTGLGAQFYLGTGLLNYAFGHEDFATYLNYANLNRFFSDNQNPNRLEYHSTQINRSPNFHDDYAFSNISELVLILPSIQDLEFNFSSKMKNIPQEVKDNSYLVLNYGDEIWFDNFNIKQNQAGNKTTIRTTRKQSSENIFNQQYSRRLNDIDEDGLDDDEEFLRNTDPYNADTDGDGILDGAEVLSGTNPTNPAQQKISRRLAYNSYDSDSDGLDDSQEVLLGTNPYDFDSDDDGYVDGTEVENGYDPLSSSPIKVAPGIIQGDGVKTVAGIKIKQTIYGRQRITKAKETQEAFNLRRQIMREFNYKNLYTIISNWQEYLDAYIYGRYTAGEIVDSIKHGSGAVHFEISANSWRKSESYRKYLNRRFK